MTRRRLVHALAIGAALWGAAPVFAAPPPALPVLPTQKISVATPPNPTPEQLLDTVEHKAFSFFWNESDARTGLTKDRAVNLERALPDTYTVASIASTGYALAALPIGVERGWVPRADAYRRAEITLSFVRARLPSVHGFYYHFVDGKTGKRVWQSELSSIDSALLVWGALAAGRYFQGTRVERLAGQIYARMNFRWMQTGDGKNPQVKTLSHGWKPESGWLPNRWARYDEASYLYLLALGSPTHALGPDAWNQWQVDTGTVAGYSVFGGATPLFFAQMMPAYVDLRGIHDRQSRDRQNRDWWRNCRNAHLADYTFCRQHADQFKTYAEGFWGITASDQPDGYGADAPATDRHFGTVAPTAMLASIYVTPGLAFDALTNLWGRHRADLWGRYGFSNAFNVDKNWYDKDVIGIDLGMMILAIENHRSGLIWNLLRDHPALQKGRAAAGMR